MEIFKPKESDRAKIDKSVMLITVILLLQIYQMSSLTYSNFQLKKDPALRIGEAAEDFCFYTTKALIEGTFSWRMFDEVTYKGLKSDPNYFEFKEDEKVKMVKVKDDQCRILTESNGRLKGLLITLNESINNPLYYKAIQINEEDTPNETFNNVSGN